MAGRNGNQNEAVVIAKDLEKGTIGFEALVGRKPKNGYCLMWTFNNEKRLSLFADLYNMTVATAVMKYESLRVHDINSDKFTDEDRLFVRRFEQAWANITEDNRILVDVKCNGVLVETVAVAEGGKMKKEHAELASRVDITRALTNARSKKVLKGTSDSTEKWTFEFNI